MEVSGQTHAMAAIPLRQEHRYTLGTRWERSQRFGEEINILLVPAMELQILGRQARSLVTISTPPTMSTVVRKGTDYLELERLLLSFLPACKFGRSFCRFSVSLHMRQYRIHMTVTGT